MRDKFFEFRPAATDPGELPIEDRHRPGDPDPCALESLAQPTQSRHAAARRPWTMHTKDKRCSPVEPDVQVEMAADVLPRRGRRDLIEQRGDRGVIGAGPWPEPAGQWWTWCQSLGSSSRRFAGGVPSAGVNNMPGTFMFCVSAFEDRQPRILARPPIRSWLQKAAAAEPPVEPLSHSATRMATRNEANAASREICAVSGIGDDRWVDGRGRRADAPR